MAQSIQEIKQILLNQSKEDQIIYLKELESDHRSGVQQIIESYKKKESLLQKEIARIEAMKDYEYTYVACDFICGIDEVGRGPLAGPVVAGAVILPKDCDILYLNDSKKLSTAKREALYIEIYEKALAVGIGMADETVIDDINILQANYQAMRMAINNLKIKPDLLLNDAVTIPGVDISQIPIIKGDTKSISIAAASIVAKVTRDRLMCEYDSIYPEYDFAGNKGYGTAKHIEAIKKYGACEIHRRTFIRNFV